MKRWQLVSAGGTVVLLGAAGLGFVACADSRAATRDRGVVREAEVADAPLVSPKLAQAAREDPWPSVAPKPLPGDRIYSKVRHLWITPQPAEGGWLGYISMGDSVRVKGGDRDKAFVSGSNGKWCDAWYAVEPVGYVCTGANATLDANDPDIVELKRHAADRSSPWPYRYSESLMTPVYHQLPSPLEQRQRELGLEEHLAAVTQPPAPDAPPKLLDLPPGGMALQSQVVNGSTIAYTSAFDHGGRTFMLTWDRGYVPVDKTKAYPEIGFHGVVLGEKHQLPIAFFRGEDRAKHRLKSGSFSPTGEKWARLSWVALTGREQGDGDERFLETREDGLWVRATDATVARHRSELPPEIAAKREGRRTWADVSIDAGTFVAYEGERAVYATLISPGRGGAPVAGVPTLDTASTPTGNFNILAKFVTATMVSGSISSLIHAEVQYTQNIGGPYALHGAYWHDRFGEPKSGGCVNLSPIDSQRIFEWTDPQLPEGWHGMRSITSAHSFGDRTVISIHR